MKTPASRIAGYDLARALAIMGMVVAHFRWVMDAYGVGPAWLAWLADRIDGRAAATFVVLAGVGISLMSRRAREAGDVQAMLQTRNRLLRRALFLFVVGYAYATVWQADILHCYGVYMAVGAFLLAASGRALWRIAAVLVAVYLPLMGLFNYESGWEWESMFYHGFWTPKGLLMNLFYNGFTPVIPWLAFLLVGMWLGRQDLFDPVVRKRILVRAASVALATEAVSSFLVHRLTAGATEMEKIYIEVMVGTWSMPPLPLYMLAGGGTAVTVITLCVAFARSHPSSKLLSPMVATGQLALTLYIGHVFIGVSTLNALGLLGKQSLPFALASAAVFCACAVLFAYAWRQRYEKGPLEWFMRKVTRS
ncbi:MAG: DUF418 domain-containing protein [Acidobacteriota bacterium]|nr:MAG: DUF418 domain-containing protein [Acidobacteriota bacterium]